MIALELSCVAIIALYVGVRARIDPSPKAFLGRLVLLMAASWIGENSVIHAYHFYAYSPRWSVFVDQVPLLVITIWPVVIHSAWDLAKRLTDRPSRVVFVASALVLADASLIEPIAVKAGLWWWNEPGLFEVPPIGILGWALFAWGCFFVFEHRRLHKAWTLPFAPALVHPLLLVCWWGFFRWLNDTVPPWPVVGVAWVLSLVLAGFALRSGAGKNIPRHELLLRVPAAGFFFVLLALHAREEPALMAYAFAFAPPYLVLTAQARGTDS
ncbi:MAG: carotenoid biosynthesis protein [Sandaracinaceae bacterium]